MGFVRKRNGVCQENKWGLSGKQMGFVRKINGFCQENKWGVAEK